MVAPCVVLIFYHNCAIIVNKGYDIPLTVPAVEISVSVILYADNSRIIVDKFKPVALLDEPAVAATLLFDVPADYNSTVIGDYDCTVFI